MLSVIDIPGFVNIQNWGYWDTKNSKCHKVVFICCQFGMTEFVK